ncbi:MAG: hypothetical protein KAY37_04060 [Phycisphaerae bacterium]|nr:hypothetical protein [Phycisphaerae bacterium]
MSVWYLDVTVRKHQGAEAARVVPCYVDLGVEASVLPSDVLAELGVVPDSTAAFRRLDGAKLKRRSGWAFLEVEGRSAYERVAFGEPDDIPLLAKSTLARLELFVDPLHRGIHPLKRN